jgi:hypothetical protein
MLYTRDETVLVLFSVSTTSRLAGSLRAALLVGFVSVPSRGDLDAQPP